MFRDGISHSPVESAANAQPMFVGFAVTGEKGVFCQVARFGCCGKAVPGKMAQGGMQQMIAAGSVAIVICWRNRSPAGQCARHGRQRGSSGSGKVNGHRG